MKYLVFIFYYCCLINQVRSGVLKNSEDQPITHQDAICGSMNCPNNYRCELPRSDSECDDDDGCSTTPKCVPIPAPKSICKENEELRECGSACEPTCDSPNAECAPTCMTNVCQCKSGLFRDPATGKCVERMNCSTCSLECSENEKCEFVDMPCEQKPCRTIDVCVLNNKENENDH